MNRSEVAIKGSTIGVLSQIINLIVKFVVRTYAIRFLGMEILGLDGVLIDAISMLSLAEMGITSAMIYRLYVPIIKDDKKTLNLLMASYRLIYTVIAVVVTVLGVMLSVFLPWIVKDIEASWTQVYVAFFLQLACSVSSYFIAYHRILLNADQKKHLCLIVDLVSNVFFSIVKIGVIVKLHSYSAYLAVGILQVIGANIVLLIYTKRHYPYINNKEKAKKNDLIVIFKDAKEVLGNKLASYVYSGTDNMIISAVMGTGIVGYLSNYKYVSTALKGLVNSAMTTIQPLIGNYLNSDTSKEQSFRTLQRYTFVRYLIAGITTAPFIVLADLFVQLWAGGEIYIMSFSISVLLAADYYIACVYGPLGEYINGMGMFKSGKYVMIAGAVSNALLSMIGVFIWGCNGVLLATVISQLIIWIGDGIIILGKYYGAEKRYIKEYILKHASYIVYVSASTFIGRTFSIVIDVENLWLKFFVVGVVTAVSFLIIAISFCRKTDEYKYTKEMFFKVLKKLRR